LAFQDFDIAGPGDLMLQETECLKIIDEVLSALAVGEFEIRVS
jgi:histidyl-tRNA synthetase